MSANAGRTLETVGAGRMTIVRAKRRLEELDLISSKRLYWSSGSQWLDKGYDFTVKPVTQNYKPTYKSANSETSNYCAVRDSYDHMETAYSSILRYETLNDSQRRQEATPKIF